ncbi:response regulator transcription factor [Chitinophaga filiformis]|uniref:DNA-binding response regulator, NarL/FixJ family, contains REC and HTH domains n=1 Tax=Chitinophaga filiformis TaxID=104663 RepID=A0A1G7HI94_CHIFI|nr:response regulator transcription factor [Chitinophaga filiformis]SDF00145.1 DNA-binding response regulator, NarL/FixJ family, contains REC and HTH domains [Chitinophaga filiformis]
MPDTKYIAIVDDHTMFRKGLSILINLFPAYEVLFEAANGKELIDKIDPDRLPDIVLLDVNMPDMDGYASAEWLRVNYPDVKVLALSTMDAETAIIKMIRHGAKGYILKDAEPAELKQAFDEVLTLGYYYNELVTRKVMQSINHLIDEKSPLNAIVKLSDREMEFMRLACSEKSYQVIAKEMFVSERTVDGYREALFKKLNVSTRVGLVLYAVRNNLVVL